MSAAPGALQQPPPGRRLLNHAATLVAENNIPGSLGLLDPLESQRVGEYEVLFFASVDGALEEQPIVRAKIGPRSRLVRRSPVVCDFLPHGLHQDPSVRSFTFDGEAELEDFERDFLVRQRVMQLSLKTARTPQAACNSLNEPLSSCPAPRRGFFRRWLFRASILLAMVVSGNVMILMCSDPPTPPEEAAQVAFSNAMRVTLTAGRFIASAGALACQLAMGGGEVVSAPEVRHCATLSEEQELRSCLEAALTVRAEATSLPSWAGTGLESTFGESGINSFDYFVGGAWEAMKQSP